MPLLSPADALRDLYKKHGNKDIDKFPAVVTAHFSEYYRDAFDPFHPFRSSPIPLLSVQSPPENFLDGSLVAFNAMIQDTSFSSELFQGTTSEGEPGGWGLANHPHNVQYTDLRECSVFWAISIPGLSPWCSSNPPFGEPASVAIQPHKNPVPGTPHIGVQLKIYDEALASPLRVTDLLSFVGILTSEPLHSNDDMSEPIVVPTIHVLFTKPLPTTLASRTFPDIALLPDVKAVRDELIQWIAEEALDGDARAAEWTLLTVLARVQSRTPPILPVSLTLTSFPPPSDDPSATPTLHHVLSLLLPVVTTLPLSLNTLNNTSAYPESKEEDLHSGWLQQPKGAVLVFTEGGVTEGSISSRGVRNIRAAQDMMKTQSLEYIFPFSGFHFETDVIFLVIAEGKQSTFFKTDLNIPIQTKSPANQVKKRLYKPAADIVLPSAHKLAQFRQLVGGAKIGTVVIGETTGKHVEDDFVKERSTSKSMGAAGFTPDDLIRRMLMSRLVSLSFHELEVTINSWEHAKELERKSRTIQ